MRSNIVHVSAALVASALLLALVALALSGARRATARPAEHRAGPSEAPMVSIRVFDKTGTLVGPVSTPKVVKTDAEWQAALTPEQFRVTRGKGTERPFCGTLLDNKKDGVYSCVCCGLPLFTSDSKFDSGTGWPSFFQPICKENVAQQLDASHFQMATEILCARCDAHLGHVFDDGPRPTGLRFCLNSESLTFTDRKDTASLAEPALAALANENAGARAAQLSEPRASARANEAGAPNRAEAVFAGGCFWCVEAVFEELDGVIEAVSGYTGGDGKRANYDAVSSGRTGHAEAVKIIYDPSRIDFETLLRVHFATHDPTTKDRQGNDVGPQYRSAIFYANEKELATAKKVIEELTREKKFGAPIVTTLEPLKDFHEAEPYHQNYVCNNPLAGYVQGVSMPKVEKVREKFKDRLKETSPLEKR